MKLLAFWPLGVLLAVEIDVDRLGDRVVWLAAVLVALGVLWRYVVKPAIEPIRAGVEVIRREMERNGGDTLKDAIDRHGAAIEQHGKQLRQIGARLARVERAVRGESGSAEFDALMAACVGLAAVVTLAAILLGTRP